MKLFEVPPDPCSTRHKRYSELSFTYYQQTARADMSRVRSLIEMLFSEFPEGEHKASLASLMRASDDGFDSAFFELFLHSLLRRLGCELEPEPMLGELGPSRPDFSVTLPNGTEVYVEAVVANGKSNEKRRRDANLGVLYDYINEKLKSPRFFWRIEIVQFANRAPRSKAVLRALQEHADTLDWAYLATRSNASALMEAASILIESNGWVFRFSPIPKRPEAFTKESRPLGWFPLERGWSATKDQLRAQISKKRKQHGTLDRPLVLAINAIQIDVDDEDFIDAVYGSEAVEVQYGPDHRPIQFTLTRARDGAWLDNKGTKHEHMPYILGFQRLSPTNIALAKVCLYTNPYIRLDESFLMPNLPRLMPAQTCFNRVPGSSLAEIFGLPEGWPENGEANEV
ncbi:MAG: hypothetical protein KatS3mg015_0956 [Fimbriimonadales bacterium]|nr:MAG: hypothetical protein KatS3mg015_0956 [Fimbriimonadales bacterium]